MGASSYGKVATGAHLSESFVFDLNTINAAGVALQDAANPHDLYNKRRTPRAYRPVLHSLWGQSGGTDIDVTIRDRSSALPGSAWNLTFTLPADGTPVEIAGVFQGLPKRNIAIEGTAAAGQLNIGMAYDAVGARSIVFENEAAIPLADGEYVVTGATSGFSGDLVVDSLGYSAQGTYLFYPHDPQITPIRGETFADIGASGWTGELVGIKGLVAGF